MSDMYSIHLIISKVENGQYLAESDDIPGLVAQGRTVNETVEIAQNVAKKLMESYIEHGDPIPTSLKPVSNQIESDLIFDRLKTVIIIVVETGKIVVANHWTD